MMSRVAAFTVDAAAGRAPILRREVKFALPNVDAGKFRSILDVNCRRVHYRRATSRVCSIYFDDASLSACHANIDGTPRRSKTRIRWYDVPFAEDRFFFEIKKREDYGIAKEGIPILTTTPLASMSFLDIVSELRRVLPPNPRELLMARAEPKLMIEYKRSYYEAKDGPLRITLDRDLVFWSQVGKLCPSRRFAVRVPGLVILEAKTAFARENQIRRLLYPLEPWVTRSSKYVLACQYLGFLPGTHFGPI